MSQKDYIDFIDTWMERKENCGSSFTYWKALYDWIKECRFDLYDLWIRDSIVEDITCESWADRERVDNLSDEALVEMLDISVLDSYWRQVQTDVDEEDMKDIFDELDSIDEFETRSEFEKKVQELVEDSGNTNLNWRYVADRYEEENFLSIKNDEDDN